MIEERRRVRVRQDVYKKALKKRRGLTSQRIADRLNLDPTALSHYVSGRRDMPFDLALRVADWLDIELDQLADMSTYVCKACGCKGGCVGSAA